MPLNLNSPMEYDKYSIKGDCKLSRDASVSVGMVCHQITVCYGLKTDG